MLAAPCPFEKSEAVPTPRTFQPSPVVRCTSPISPICPAIHGGAAGKRRKTSAAEKESVSIVAAKR